MLLDQKDFKIHTHQVVTHGSKQTKHTVDKSSNDCSNSCLIALSSGSTDKKTKQTFRMTVAKSSKVTYQVIVLDVNYLK
jgi:hypothetical protein